MDVIVCTGGGTGGHVYPGLAVIEELNLRWKGEILWVGSSNGMERAIVETAGIRFRGIPSGKLRRSFSLANFADSFRVLAGLAASFWLFRKIRPAIVFSKGGYVSVPPVVAAWLLRIPVITHESDLDPGLATRHQRTVCRKICVPYEESLSHFPARLSAKLRVTENPVRQAIRTGSANRVSICSALGEETDPLRPRGSQGAREINVLVRTVLPKLQNTAMSSIRWGRVNSNPSMRRLSPFPLSQGRAAPCATRPPRPWYHAPSRFALGIHGGRKASPPRSPSGERHPGRPGEERRTLRTARGRPRAPRRPDRTGRLSRGGPHRARSRNRAEMRERIGRSGRATPRRRSRSCFSMK